MASPTPGQAGLSSASYGVVAASSTGHGQRSAPIAGASPLEGLRALCSSLGGRWRDACRARPGLRPALLRAREEKSMIASTLQISPFSGNGLVVVGPAAALYVAESERPDVTFISRLVDAVSSAGSGRAEADAGRTL